MSNILTRRRLFFLVFLPKATPLGGSGDDEFRLKSQYVLLYINIYMYARLHFLYIE